MSHEEVLNELKDNFSNWKSIYESKFPEMKVDHWDKEGNHSKKWIYPHFKKNQLYKMFIEEAISKI